MKNHDEQASKMMGAEPMEAELEALDARLAELGRAERGDAPGSLEGRVVMATSALLVAPRSARPGVRAMPRSGVLAALGARRLDWPMRVAAVIAVMIGGWAVIHGVDVPGGPARPTGVSRTGAPAARSNVDLLTVLASLERTGASEQLQRLLSEVDSLEAVMADDEQGGNETLEQEG